jgi:hypothetical protein
MNFPRAGNSAPSLLPTNDSEHAVPNEALVSEPRVELKQRAEVSFSRQSPDLLYISYPAVLHNPTEV